MSLLNTVGVKNGTLKHSTPIFLFGMVLNSLFRLVINYGLGLHI